ncbi:MAG TPA: hypothetical protein VKX17_15280 [Planctomycetota bacterium]|nr:hypothetical protein [Planctomycetota bacterium]
MSDTSFPLDPSALTVRRNSSRYNIAFERLMEEPVTRKTPMGTDTAWALKLKNCVDTVVRELRIEVLSAKPVRCFSEQDSRDMLFEVDTNRGQLEVIRSRTGQHTYEWKADALRHV